MPRSLLLGGGLLAFGVLILGVLVYNVRKYRRIDQRYPERSPDELFDGRTASVRGTISDRSATVPSPFEQVDAVASFWAVENYVESRKDSHYSTRLDWKERVDAFELDVDGRTVTVEMTDDTEPIQDFIGLPDVPYDDYSREFDDDESPPERVQQYLAEFQQRYDGESLNGMSAATVEDRLEKLQDRRRKRRYSESRFEPGEEVVVYGSGAAGSGPTARADYLASTSDLSAIKRKFRRNSVVALVISLLPLGAGAFFLGVVP